MRTMAVALIGTTVLGSASLAQPADSQAGESDQASQEGMLTTPHEPLRFTFAPYLWAASMSGSAGLGRFTSDVDAAFTDVLSSSDTIYGLQGHLEVGRDRWTLFFDATWVHSEVDGIPGLIEGAGAEFNVASDMAIMELGGTWTLARGLLDQESEAAAPRAWNLDAMLGGRVNLIDVEIEATRETPDPVIGDDPRRKSRSEEWIEPFIGLRGGFDFAEHWRLGARADVGGFGLGSDFAWQAAVLVGYDFEMWGTDSTFFFGYRALSEDYEAGSGRDRFEWDVLVHGPMLGLAIEF